MSSAKIAFNEPATLPPPVPGYILSAPPFSIPTSAFYAALDMRVQITIGAIYVATVITLNTYNRSNGNKSWKIGKTKAFFWFVVAHNVFLAVYSGWTFQGLMRAVYRMISSGSEGIAGTVDSLSKMHGEAGHGLGNAIAYNATVSKWISENPSTFSTLLSATGTRGSTDIGRLWNEGLAFYGWIFYVSKFYEVVDTAIIIAKGKRCPTLQTYHHAGAIMCMWSLWIAYNSGIYTIMLSVPIPRALKKGLTIMQIIQFLVGASYAALNFSIAYTLPIQVPSPKSSSTALTYDTEYQTVLCINTSGEMFAIWFNVLYLTPLIVLFVRFFVKSYFQ
ncbi:hypothetical protein LOCC1_G007416 [Lachnellula occidentalis]|uniref:Elongation of fatty acids protein n=1 Tax=Lachnellula occidentalis TaxID=215460 RepID=A0A8H8UAT1_9HELO|nr:hypothetical protein LOCC1_G007416 [Lachnellula occidentalis]